MTGSKRLCDFTGSERFVTGNREIAVQNVQEVTISITPIMIGFCDFTGSERFVTGNRETAVLNVQEVSIFHHTN